jgi:uncharacterized protein (TIGR02588 family)
VADDRDARSQRVSATPVELTLSVLGAAAILAIIGYLLLTQPAQESGSPQIALTLRAAEPGPAGWVVPFVATNHADAPAQEVHLEVRVEFADGEVQHGAAVLDFLGGRSSAEGGFTLSRDPGKGSILARAVGFAKP